MQPNFDGNKIFTLIELGSTEYTTAVIILGII
jgi:hypothetical protein